MRHVTSRSRASCSCTLQAVPAPHLNGVASLLVDGVTLLLTDALALLLEHRLVPNLAFLNRIKTDMKASLKLPPTRTRSVRRTHALSNV